jgi:proteasome accessory factor C
MTANAQNQVERMLALVPYLRDRDGIAVDQVARDFGVKPAQIVKDLKVLWFCGLPNSVSGDMIDIDMEALDGEGVVKLSNADYLTRPLRLAPHEALALMVALRALREVSAPGERDVVDRALKKIEAATGDIGERAAAVDIHIDPVDTQIRIVVEQALRDGKRLAITYYTPSRDATTDREVDPMRLIFFEGHSYLEAWCLQAEEVRMFRLDRMRSAAVLDLASNPPAEAPRVDLSGGIFQPDESDPTAVLELEPQARWVADYYPVEGVEELGEGRLRVRLRFSNNGWLERLVLRLGGYAKLLEPRELGEDVRARARAALANYAS